MKSRLYLLSMIVAFYFSCSVVKADSLMVQEPYFKDMQIGLCVKKFTGFYWVSGISIVINKTLFGAPISTGANLTTSYLGSALFSDALPLHMFELFGHYHFRSKRSLQPFAGVNLGGAFTNYKYPGFKRLQQAQTLLSPEFGLDYKFKFPFHAAASFGYNLITGNGKRGLGLVYPLYWQIKVLYEW